jgi:hypothetical protein
MGILNADRWDNIAGGSGIGRGSMRRSATASRLTTAATMAALASSLVLGGGSVLANQTAANTAGGGTIHAHARPRPSSDGVRQQRRVNVRDLPASHGTRQPYQAPRLGKSAISTTPRSPSSLLVAPAPVFVTNTTNAHATEAVSYAGLAHADTGFEPPDPWIAVGPEHVVQAVNTTFQMTNRVGTGKVTTDMLDFFGISAIPGYFAEVFDPRVIFDSLHGRWIAIEASFDCFDDVPNGINVGTGYLDIAVSDSADPTKTWSIFSIYYTDAVPDYPGIGTSTDKVVVTGNIFALATDGAATLGCSPQGNLLATEIDAMAWSQLLTPDLPNVDYFFSPADFPNNFFSWRPALQTPATSATVFVVSERGDEGVAYTKITGNPANATSAMSVPADLTAAGVVSGFALPPAPKQQGPPTTIVNALDARPTDAVWQNGLLSFVSTYPCDPAGGIAENRDCVRVTELSTSPATPTLHQDFLISEEGADLYMGGVGYAGNGTLHAVWTRSSGGAGQYPSSYTAYRLPADPVNKVSVPFALPLAAGTGTYLGDRWGDYVGVAQDPQVPNAVWQGDEFSAGVNFWATHISQLQTGGAEYVPITPLRVLDPRPAHNIGLSGVFNANVPRTWQVTGVGTIPAGAIAVTGNLAVVGQTAAGYGSVTPNPTATPSTSSLNFPLGDVRANNVTVPLSTTGKLSAVYKAVPGKTTYFIFDVTGYFLPGLGHATYATTTPVRVMDTRTGTNHVGPLGVFHANVPQTLTIAGTLGIPLDAIAVTANIAVVGQTQAGYVSVTPDPDAAPPTATMNFPLGDIRANGLTARLNGAGQLSIVYKAGSATTHLILDITGYYRQVDAGLLFYPLNPGRIVDTRPGVVLSQLSGLFTANIPRTLSANGHWGVPNLAGAITGNLSIVAQTQAGYVAITPDPNPNPTTATMNFPLGDVRGNGVTAPLNASTDLSFVYKAGTGAKTHLILDVTGYFK